MKDIKKLANELALAILSKNHTKISQITEEIKKYKYSNTQIEELTTETAIDLENLEPKLLRDYSTRERNKKNIKNSIILENTNSSDHTELIKMILSDMEK